MSMHDTNLPSKDIKYGILHNRKTTGTALKEIIDQQKQRTPNLSVYCFGHAMTFPQFIKDYPYSQAVFFIREPISRFVSGFYSRQRKGQPRYFFPWSSAEKRAFSKFTTPNQLAESLSNGFFTRRDAAQAMRSIGHVRHTYVDFLGTPTFLQKNLHKIAFIGHQPEFNNDLDHLRLLLSLDSDILPPDEDIKAHRNPADLDKYLSSVAIQNLKKWYEQDFKVYDWCLQTRAYFVTKKEAGSANSF